MTQDWQGHTHWQLARDIHAMRAAHQHLQAVRSRVLEQVDNLTVVGCDVLKDTAGSVADVMSDLEHAISCAEDERAKRPEAA